MGAGTGQVEHHAAASVMVGEPRDLRKSQAVSIEGHHLVQSPGLAGLPHLHEPIVVPRARLRPDRGMPFSVRPFGVSMAGRSRLAPIRDLQVVVPDDVVSAQVPVARNGVSPGPRRPDLLHSVLVQH